MSGETPFLDHYVPLKDALVQMDNEVREYFKNNKTIDSDLECTLVDKKYIPWGHVTNIALELAWDFLRSLDHIYALKNEDAQEISKAYVESPSFPNSDHGFTHSISLDNQHIHLPDGTVGSSNKRKTRDNSSRNEADDQKYYGDDLGKYITVKRSDLDKFLAEISDKIVKVTSIMHKSEGEVKSAYQEFVDSLRNEPAPDRNTQDWWFKTNNLKGRPITQKLRRKLKKDCAPGSWKLAGTRPKKRAT